MLCDGFAYLCTLAGCRFFTELHCACPREECRNSVIQLYPSTLKLLHCGVCVCIKPAVSSLRSLASSSWLKETLDAIDISQTPLKHGGRREGCVSGGRGWGGGSWVLQPDQVSHCLSVWIQAMPQTETRRQRDSPAVSLSVVTWLARQKRLYRRWPLALSSHGHMSRRSFFRCS